MKINLLRLDINNCDAVIMQLFECGVCVESSDIQNICIHSQSAGSEQTITHFKEDANLQADSDGQKSQARIAT